MYIIASGCVHLYLPPGESPPDPAFAAAAAAVAANAPPGAVFRSLSDREIEPEQSAREEQDQAGAGLAAEHGAGEGGGDGEAALNQDTPSSTGGVSPQGQQFVRRPTAVDRVAKQLALDAELAAKRQSGDHFKHVRPVPVEMNFPNSKTATVQLVHYETAKTGEYFGEIALLAAAADTSRSVGRRAFTARAMQYCEVYVLQVRLLRLSLFSQSPL